MILLDTDHLTVLGFPGTAKYAVLKGRIDASPDQSFATTVVTAEGQVRGLLALIARAHDIRDQIPPYDRLAWLFDFFRRRPIVPLNHAAADEFDRLRRAKVRIGTHDLRSPRSR